MDLLGEIIERDVQPPAPAPSAPSSGFPELYEPEKISSWKVRLQQKKREQARAQRSGASDSVSGGKSVRRSEAQAVKPKSEAEQIDRENTTRLSSMTPKQFEFEKQELLDSIDPRVLEAFRKRISKKQMSSNSESDFLDTTKAPLFAEIEGAPGTWVGGDYEEAEPSDSANTAANKSTTQANSDLKKVRFEKTSISDESDQDANEEQLLAHKGIIADEDDIAPQEYQFMQKMDHMTNEELMQDVHFINPAQNFEETFQSLDINDPNFDRVLHKKYFPNLPKEVDKLAWMKPVHKITRSEVIYDVTECRFDFKGDLIPPTRLSSTTRDGLHHHSEDPDLPGYTILELQHLSRSTFAPQRSMAIQIIGRILYKMGKQAYREVVPEVDAETYEELGGTDAVVDKIYAMFWDLCKSCMLVESILDAADETRTKNISIRNYALEALWLWKQGGGDFRKEQAPTN
ncbi:LAMI_0F00694g1_1 [Lachancea mirantina]|uniref:LAMI_0F00694g1_1 n=1 Tax=Lachancea mirantina TaxID=1230905 RepID=A0A1G4JVH3_9SACH|nr:LAMI_0F00694g1_1 [Lachancea mirantina]